MRTHHMFLAIFLGCFLVCGQVHAGWVPVATVNEKTPGGIVTGMGDERRRN